MKVSGPVDMEKEARRFAAGLSRRADRAQVIALSGPIGAGKTTFSQGIARALGIEEHVTSPTFVIEKIYELESKPYDGAQGKPFERLIHIDAYRLDGPHDLEMLGWNELVGESSNLILVEWPEHVAGLIPDDATRITLSGADDSREIIYG